MTNILYFGAGSLHNRFIGPWGNSNIRFPLWKEMMEFPFNCNITWCGFTYKQNKKSPLLDLLDIREEGNVIDMSQQVNIIDPQNQPALTHYLQHRHEPCLFIELRPFEGKDGYNFLAESIAQEFLIKTAIENKVKIFIWDQDGWALQIPQQYRPHIDLLVAYNETELKDYGFKTVNSFHFFYDAELANRYKMIPFNKRKIDLAYCGNVYGRREDFVEYVKPFHDANKKILVCGNWLRKKYDDRDFVLDNLPNAIIAGETEHWSTLPVLNAAKYCIHVANPLQQKLGIISIRVFECFMAKNIIFCSSEINGIENFVTEEQILRNIDNENDIVKYVESLDLASVYEKWEDKLFNRNSVVYATNKLKELMRA